MQSTSGIPFSYQFLVLPLGLVFDSWSVLFEWWTRKILPQFLWWVSPELSPTVLLPIWGDIPSTNFSLFMCSPEASLTVPFILCQDSTCHTDPILSLLNSWDSRYPFYPPHERARLTESLPWMSPSIPCHKTSVYHADFASHFWICLSNSNFLCYHYILSPISEQLGVYQVCMIWCIDLSLPVPCSAYHTCCLESSSAPKVQRNSSTNKAQRLVSSGEGLT